MSKIESGSNNVSYQGELPGFPASPSKDTKSANHHTHHRSHRVFPDGHFKELEKGHMGKVLPPTDSNTWNRIQRKG